jgi:hypothetical protein
MSILKLVDSRYTRTNTVHQNICKVNIGTQERDTDMEARIYQPARNALQSGQANTRNWIVEYEPEEAKQTDALMGWVGSGDMRGQLKLKFDSKEDAIAYVERHAIPYTVRDPEKRRQRPKSYADNFRFDKVR